MANIVPRSATVTYDTVRSAVIQKILASKPIEQSYETNAVLSTLLREYNLQGTKGGQAWLVPVRAHGTTGDAQVVEKGRPLATSDSDTVTYAEYKRVYYAKQVVMYETDMSDTTDPDRVFDLYAEKVSYARDNLENTVAGHLFATSQGTDGGFNELTGIPLAAPIDPTASVEYGGLNGAAGSQTWWRSQTITTSGNASTVLPPLIDRVDYDLAAGGGKRWDVGVVTSTIHRILKQYAKTYATINLNPQSAAGRRIADLGFDVVEHNGRPIIWDRNAVSGRAYFWRKEALRFAVKKDKEFKMGPWARLESGGQLGEIAYLQLCCQLVTFERRGILQISGYSEA